MNVMACLSVPEMDLSPCHLAIARDSGFLRGYGGFQRAVTPLQNLRNDSGQVTSAISGLAGIYVTVPNTLDVLDMLDWAYLAPRPQHCPAEPGSTTGDKAPPAAASAPSTPLSKRQVPGAMYK
jgi:hypothetical protein